MFPIYLPMKKIFLLIFLLLSSLSVAAKQQPTSNEAYGVILQQMQVFISTIKQTKFDADKTKARKQIHKIIEKTLDIDFAIGTKRVMGRYWGNATIEQKEKIENMLRNRSFANLETIMLEGDQTQLSETFQYNMRTPKKRHNIMSELILVEMQPYEIQQDILFAMTYSRAYKKWNISNVIVNGLNAIVLLRARFHELMRVHKNNYNRVINFALSGENN